MSVNLEALRAHLDGTEERANACRGEAWELADGTVYGAASADVIAEVGSHRTNTWQGVGEHIVHWSPARVLRWVAAARKVLEIHEPVKWDTGREYCRACSPASVIPARPWPCPTVEAIASVYGEEP